MLAPSSPLSLLLAPGGHRLFHLEGTTENLTPSPSSFQGKLKPKEEEGPDPGPTASQTWGNVPPLFSVFPVQVEELTNTY